MKHQEQNNFANARRDEWAVILAGGDGTRLKSLTRHIAGDERPKQFCSVLGGDTLLEETQDRAALEFAPKRTLYLVNRAHENFYRPLLINEPTENLIVQPSNRGTWASMRLGFSQTSRNRRRQNREFHLESPTCGAIVL